MAATQTPEQVVRAEAKWVRLSARKARVVLANIRGRSVPEARTILAFTQRAAAIEIEKVLRSAVANAETNPLLHWNGDDLVIRRDLRRRGPDAQALAPARAWPRQPDHQAHLPHHDRARPEPEGRDDAHAARGRAHDDRGPGSAAETAAKPKRAAKPRAKKKEAVA